MKRISCVFAFLVGVFCCSLNIQAQENFSSFGPAVSIPLGDFGDFSGVGLGGNFQLEFGLSEHFALGTGIEAHYFLSKDYDVAGIELKGQSTLIIPLSGFAKYYLSQQRSGVYVAVNTGFYPVFMLYYDEDGDADEVDSDFDFGWAPELGFYLTEGISIYAKCQFIYHTTLVHDFSLQDGQSKKQTLTYINVGANFSF